ncbi:cyclopropane-fatty-acyl-phospholipid synthase [Dulcicalothrix desertica PCC 7102]|uniref:Cyclopropane-fatty-acyl-phospholipid synthase n=1 Tax=Dulcicalothrix desertica PCC 7102 TaxID=232991 RepID=A0A433VE43_9CYAN|nr:FAD-dependent oxidoreductase [Dulcicalothrix desertica]RUT04371.1 cyclopropane-fatty-acyl-phospholipid synthase [Dulcicalothrix desertica PCC 7102]TWH51227.1 putative NAD/FAD-binding protein [Dulcicalothrix desertica PCC 7102]
MKIAIIGGGASGMVTAYLLNKNGHHVTVFERQPVLGGHIRTINKNVKSHQFPNNLFLEGGVIEFPLKFYNFFNLMKELEVELESVDIGSSLFLKDGRHFLSGSAIRKNYTGFQRLIEFLRLDTIYARSTGFWLKTHLAQIPDLYDKPMSYYLKSSCIRNTWVKLLAMYSYSMPFELIDNFPAELAIPVLRDYMYTGWVRIKGGVYSYIEKILDKFNGDILLNVEVANISRKSDIVKIELVDGEAYTFDKIVFATPPDQVMKLLSDPTDDEIKRFSQWKKNEAQTILHTDTSMYHRYEINKFSEFDFFETESGWGYNAYLNQLCGVTSDQKYSLAFNLDSIIVPNKTIHIFDHHTPLYTVDSFKYRDEVVMTNGENNTYHVGAYLADGLHEGAVTSAIRVANAIGY